MRRVRRGMAAALAVLFVAGCGGRAAPQRPVAVTGEDAQAEESPASSEAAPTEAPPSAPADRPGGGRSPMAPPTLRATGNPDYGSQHNNGAVHLELSAECVRPGDVLVVTIISAAKAGLGMVIGYADNQAHGAMSTGETDANGRYTWRVPVAPTVPEGQARVLVSATGANWSKDGGGTADRVFQVAHGGC